jgi:hypothetical protein
VQFSPPSYTFLSFGSKHSFNLHGFDDILSLKWKIKLNKYKILCKTVVLILLLQSILKRTKNVMLCNHIFSCAVFQSYCIYFCDSFKLRPIQ